MLAATVPCLLSKPSKNLEDLVLTGLASTDVLCHGGNNGIRVVSYEGGVDPMKKIGLVTTHPSFAQLAPTQSKSPTTTLRCGRSR